MRAFVTVPSIKSLGTISHRSQSFIAPQVQEGHATSISTSRCLTICAIRASIQSSQTPATVKTLLNDALEDLDFGLGIDADAETMDDDEAEVKSEPFRHHHIIF